VQSVNNIPTIVNGHLNFNNQPLASDNDVNKESYASNLVMESEVEMSVNKAKESYASNLVMESEVVVSVNKAKDIGDLKHKILISRDSHVRGCAGRMSASMDARFEVCGVVKPGCCTDSISGTVSDEVNRLTKNDFLVLSSGANDISKNDTRIAFRNIVNYIKNTSHTNVILMGVPPRYDAPGCSQLNNSIKLFNNKLDKLTKIFCHVTMSERISNRLLYTKHGSHLNTLRQGNIS
jgi:hypothetical protein